MFLELLRRNRAKSDAVEAEKMARLERAERDLGDLQARGYHAVRALDERGGRNHWRESVEEMIRGTY